MRLVVASLCLFLAVIGSTAIVGRAEIPKPNLYPKSWALKFEYATPKRIVVNVPGKDIPQAYWYLTYTVTNASDQEQQFLPVFEMLINDGNIVRSDLNIPQQAFDAIKAREKKQFLEPAAVIAGTIRLGEDQARDGLAIWPEPMPRMGSFSIFIQGLSGEYTKLKVGDKDVILRKTLQLNYFIRGDEVYPGEDKVNENASAWIMR